MSKRILAVGNGNELTEVTPYGILLVHKWDKRRGEYVAHSGDWTGTDGVNARRGIRINTEPNPCYAADVADRFNREAFDAIVWQALDQEARINSYTESMAENCRRQLLEGVDADDRYNGRMLVEQENEAW